MSEQENNKMEAWLKAYRQQRLDQWNEAPGELDEPTRAMLMAEVRRQNPAASATPEASTETPAPTLGWMRWALGGMTAAIVALGISSLSDFNNSKSGPDSLAQASTGSTEAKDENQARITDAPAENLKRDDIAKAVAEAESVGGGMGGVASRGSVAGSPGISGTVQAVSPQPSQVAPTHPAPRSANVRNMPARQNVKMANGNYYNHARELQLNFTQQSRARSGVAASRMMMAKQKELPKPVLVNFELKRVGNTIRVVDGDGSVYTGTVINEETLPEAEERQALALAEPGEGGGGEGAGFAGGGSAGPARFAPGKSVAISSKMRRGSQAFFRVQGTNKTLKQMVILEATLDNSVFSKKEADKPSAAMATRPASPLKPGIAPEPSGPKNLNRNLGAIRAIARMRVLGNARIGKENYPVDAYLDIKAAGKNKAPSNTPADVKKK